MIHLGIFTRTFVRPSLAERLDAVLSYGMRYTQFDLADANLDDMPDEIDPATAMAIREQFAQHGVLLSAVSGTYNMIHPDLAEREKGLRRLNVLAGACASLGTSIITLCTGTRNTASMWRWHPDNDTPAAWDDLFEAMQKAVAIAEAHNVTIAFETEPANVIDRPAKGRRLIDELGSSHLKVVMDAANLFHAGDLARQPQVLDEAFEFLGRDIVLAHAKDLTHDGEAGNVAAGKGKLDYDRYVSLLNQVEFHGGLVMHGLTEAEVPETVAFLRDKLGQ